jgi:hypothetical protein
VPSKKLQLAEQYNVLNILEMKFLIPIYTISTLLLVSCATIQDYRLLSHPTGEELRASVGSTLFRLDKQSDLPNVYGKADVYGGKVNRGYTEVKLLKIKEKRYVTLLVSDLSLQSTETVMDRYVNPGSTNVNTNVNIGTNGSGTGGIPVEIDTEEESIYTVSGVSIEITNIRGSSIDYVLFDDGTSYGVRGQNVRKY